MKNTLIKRFQCKDVCIQIFQLEDGQIEVDVVKKTKVKLFCNFEEVQCKDIDESFVNL